jgi:hypothetical protein
MTKDEALKLALEALENELAVDMTNLDEIDKAAQQMLEAIWAIKQALAAPVQPVATLFGSLPVYDTTPPAAQRQYPQAERTAWVGLTDEEIDLAIGFVGSIGARQDARAIEAKLKEKNT